jgi:predicted ATPase
MQKIFLMNIYLNCNVQCSGLLERYNGLIRQGVLQEDVQQKNVVEALDNLLQQMVPFNRNMELYHVL